MMPHARCCRHTPTTQESHSVVVLSLGWFQEDLQAICSGTMAAELFQYFYHLTHVSNLRSIMARGIFSHTKVRRDRIGHRDISDPAVQCWRSRAEPVYGHAVHDYAPLYLTPKNPMLYTRRAMQDEIVILCVATSVLDDTVHLFTDGNAASRDTQFSNNSAVLRNAMRALKALRWSDLPDGRRHRCAEVLVHEHVAPHFVEKIVCSNQRLARHIQATLALQADVDSSIYF